MTLDKIRLGKGRPKKEVEAERRYIYEQVSAVPVIELESHSELSRSRYAGYTGDKIEAFKSYFRKYGSWPSKVYHFRDGLGSDHWRMIIPRPKGGVTLSK